jgi:uncharacterized protein YjbJ (UPF0337 family)
MFTTMEARMMRLQAKVQGLTKQTIGQMIGDDKVVLEGEEEQRQAGGKSPSIHGNATSSGVGGNSAAAPDGCCGGFETRLGAS